MTPRHGKAEAVKFFETIGQMEVLALDVLNMMEGDHQVAVEFVLEGLHLSKRLNKDSAGSSATYRSRG